MDAEPAAAEPEPAAEAAATEDLGVEGMDAAGLSACIRSPWTRWRPRCERRAHGVSGVSARGDVMPVAAREYPMRGGDRGLGIWPVSVRALAILVFVGRRKRDSVCWALPSCCTISAKPRVSSALFCVIGRLYCSR